MIGIIRELCRNAELFFCLYKTEYDFFMFSLVIMAILVHNIMIRSKGTEQTREQGLSYE